MPGPVPAFSNVPINPEFYNPSRFEISDISLGLTTLITTTEDHNYVIGELIRLIVPAFFGTYQLDEQLGYVIDIPASNQIVLNINSQGMNAFTISTARTRPQTLPIGDINQGVINANGNLHTGTFIPGSFINVSPV